MFIFDRIINRFACAVMFFQAVFIFSVTQAQRDGEIGDIRYFVVAKSQAVFGEGFDSYILPLYEPEDISHARDLIAQGPGIGRPMVGAEIGAWPSLVNRNYLQEGAPPWSWTVTRFRGFSSSTVFILDGTPTIVEMNLDARMMNPFGGIAFIQYTVIGELSIQPSEILTNGVRHSHWFGFFTDNRYPWHFSFELGWLYIFGMNPFDIWLWMPDMGFLWTNEEIYPFLWREEDQSWIWFSRGSITSEVKETPRYFFNFRTEEWEVFESPALR